MTSRACLSLLTAGFILMATLAGPLAGFTAARPAMGDSMAPGSGMQPLGAAKVDRLLGGLTDLAPERKIEPALQALAAERQPKEAVFVVIQSTAPLDLGRFSRAVHQFTWPAGEHVAVARVRLGDLERIAALSGAYAVSLGEPELAPPAVPAVGNGPMGPASDIPAGDVHQVAVGGESSPDRPASSALDEPTPIDPVILGARLRAAPAWSALAEDVRPVSTGARKVTPGRNSPAPGGSNALEPARVRDSDPRPDDWFEIGRGHAVEEAWAMGYRGEGVTVAVLDYAVDFAHPDLQGTWYVLPDSHPYAGWPEVFDPYVGLRMAQFKASGQPAAANPARLGQIGMIELYQTSKVAGFPLASTAAVTACFQALVVRTGASAATLAEPSCDFVVPATSKSGEVRFGHHPDLYLANANARPEQGITREYAGVLLVDEATAGTYDTVYVDLDGDHDFSDEKPVTQEDPLSWRDISNPPDGIADVSGGLLYFISDGQRPFPASWLWGLDQDIPPAGRFIGLHYASSSHGTMCASNIVSQGRLGVPPDRSLRFRDLPGGQPEAINYGLAPKAQFVSVGSVYATSALYGPSWRFVVLGTDPERPEDDVQIASNSYGFSAVDNDGWDADARLIDYYVRHFNPSTSFVIAAGNGGPGYGTVTTPNPTVGIKVAASTQMGSTGTDSITDTNQITFGDIIPWSNRGPGAVGSVGIHIAADGAYAAGAVPLNIVADGLLSNGTWGGTSRATPVVAGGLALVYQAFREKHGRWPTWEEARAILMAGARYAAYDPLVMGAGILDVTDAVKMAAGKHGVYALPADWAAGSYRGTRYPAFAKLVAPGEVATTTITLHNPSPQPIDLALSAQTLRRIGSHEAVLRTDATQASGQGRTPDYLMPIDRSWLPGETELMVVRGRVPFEQFDINGDNTPENTIALAVLQHTDVNGDGKLWDDRNGNGVVNHRQLWNAYVDLSWPGGQRRLDAVEGSITQPLTQAGISGALAYFGRGCPGDAMVQPVAGKIALVARGTCTFNEKITSARNAGAIAVLVYTDYRPKTSMGGTAPAATLPGVMIDQQPGLELRELLLAGTEVTAAMFPQAIPLVGLDGNSPVVYPDTELQQYEYMRLSINDNASDYWEVSVHHPLQRWADGLYLAAWHSSRAITETELSLQFDFYAYQPWPAVSLSASQITVPPGDTRTVIATLRADVDAPPGLMQGAIFVDEIPRAPMVYLPLVARGSVLGAETQSSVGTIGTRCDGFRSADNALAAIEAGLEPAGYKPAHKRTVIPVIANMAVSYAWQGAVSLGGAAGHDPDAPYSNGAVRGGFRWDWRAESGDWRFFFVDAVEPPAGTQWVIKTTWQESGERQADIDTRIYGPTSDRYTNPQDPANEPENMSDVDWYGPYTLGLLNRSTYQVSGSTWPFITTSGRYEDWLALPARAGLHEVMLDAVRFAGRQFAMPFETQLGGIRWLPEIVELVGDSCGQLAVTSQVSLPDLRVSGFGMSLPTVLVAVPVRQDVAGNIPSTAFRHELEVPENAGRLAVTLDGQDDDDLDLYLLFDANRDGVFSYPGEVVAQSAGEAADEYVAVAGFPRAGRYQIWVHGYRVVGEDSTFDLTIDLVAGKGLAAPEPPTEIPAGETTVLRVCADLSALIGQDGPANGILVFGPGGAPTLFQVPVSWQRSR